MTKKDYIKAAELVKAKRVEARDTNRVIGDNQRLYEENAATEVEEAFVQFFRGDNPRFDQLRFLAACNPET